MPPRQDSRRQDVTATIFCGLLLWLPHEPPLVGVDPGRLGHPVLVVSEVTTGQIDVVIVTTLKGTLLERKWPGEEFRKRREEYIPLDCTPRRLHPDNGRILYYTITAAPSMLRQQSYVRLDPFEVPSSSLRELKDGTAKLDRKSLRLVRAEIKKCQPSYVINMTTERQNQRSTAKSSSTRATESRGTPFTQDSVWAGQAVTVSSATNASSALHTQVTRPAQIGYIPTTGRSLQASESWNSRKASVPGPVASTQKTQPISNPQRHYGTNGFEAASSLEQGSRTRPSSQPVVRHYERRVPPSVDDDCLDPDPDESTGVWRILMTMTVIAFTTFFIWRRT